VKIVIRARWTLRPLVLAALLLFGALVATVFAAGGGPLDNIMPLDQVKPGMRGEVYTIIEGDKIEKLDLEVIGILPNLMGPKQDIILVKLIGDRATEVGVAAGMSGSPVYIEGKLVGALSLKFGIFTKEALGGVTPIAHMLEADLSDAAGATPAQRAAAGANGEPAPAAYGSQIPAPADVGAWNASAGLNVAGYPNLAAQPEVVAPPQYPVTDRYLQQAGVPSGAYLSPIETPLLFSGFAKEAIDRFAPQFASYGMTAVEGGTTTARPDDANLQPGEMVGIVLATGDLSIQAGCTVTTIVDGHVLVCGHPVFNFGKMALPMSRGRVLTTMVSSFSSTKIMNSGGVIGTIDYDRISAVAGRLGAPPRLVPVSLDVVTPARTKELRFQVAENPKLTPLLLAIATFNGLVSNPVYSDGTTLHLTGRVDVEGHSPVELDNMFAPNEFFGVPDGLFVALMMQQMFQRVYTNPYEVPKVTGVQVRVESIPERRQGFIENAWSDRAEAAPGELMRIKVLLRPYRGTPFVQEVPVTIPMAARGTLRVVVSDADTLNRMSNGLAFSPFARLAGLEQLIRVLNRERRNNRLYVALLQPAPTLLVEDKELPNAPLSEIEVLGPGRTMGGPTLLRESLAGEWSVPMNQVISGQQSLQIKVK
jgi:hypothetical protein